MFKNYMFKLKRTKYTAKRRKYLKKIYIYSDSEMMMHPQSAYVICREDWRAESMDWVEIYEEGQDFDDVIADFSYDIYNKRTKLWKVV